MPYKILIVDDETMLIELLSDYLKDNDYFPIAAQSGDEAIAKAVCLTNAVKLD